MACLHEDTEAVHVGGGLDFVCRDCGETIGFIRDDPPCRATPAQLAKIRAWYAEAVADGTASPGARRFVYETGWITE